MRPTLLALHACFAATWLGCILTEAIFERALLPQGRQSQLALAHLHVRVDKFIELPSIFGVAVTGLLLLDQTGRAGVPLHTMLGAGMLAIIANLYCVFLVFKRRDAAMRGDWARFEALDHVQHKAGAIVLIGVLIALAAGYWSRSGMH